MRFVAFENLTQPPKFNPLEALAVCRQMVKDDPGTCPHGKPIFNHCGHLAACNYGFASLGLNRAVDAWNSMPKNYKHHGLDKMLAAPAGALVFWTGGSNGDGHVGISDGKGKIFANDLPTTNHYGRFAIDQVTDRFTQCEPAGWAFPYFQFAGMDNREPPEIAPADDTAHTRVVKRLIAAERDVIAAAKRGLGHDPMPELEAAYRTAIQQARARITELQALKP